MVESNKAKSTFMEVREAPGELPELWDREAVFVANLLSLFFGNELETETLREEVGALETYGGRLVPIVNMVFAGGRNLLTLEREPDARLWRYFQEDLGLNLPEIEILPHADYAARREGATSAVLENVLKTIKSHPSIWMDGFVTDELLAHTAELTDKKLISSVEGSKCGNNKLLLHRHLAEAGLPSFDTVVAESPSDVPRCLQILNDWGYRYAVVKAQIGASGVGMRKLDVSAPSGIPDYLFFEGPCLVEGWLDDSLEGIEVLGSPSVQMFVHDNRLHLYDITAQFLNAESVHEGNQAPPPFLQGAPQVTRELLQQAEVGGRWLHGIGYRGTASADFHMVRRDGKIEIRLCEINARVTGATYPAILARRFVPRGAWIMRNVMFTTPRKSDAILNELESLGILYRPGNESGVLPVNFNANDEGVVAKAQLLALGRNRDDVESAFHLIRRHPAMTWNYDRD